MYYQTSGPLTTTGATTTLALSPLLMPGNRLYPAKSVLISITNPAGSGQTINAGSLLLKDTVGGIASTITYSLGTVSIAAGANATFQVELSSGMLNNPTLSLTFAGTPSAGTLNVLTEWERTDATGGGVTSITGTANQVVASASTGAVGLSLPQSIATTSAVQFGQIGVGSNAFQVNSAGLVNQYKAVATSGLGVPAIYGYGRAAAVTNQSQASVATYTVGAADGTFLVSANVLITSVTTASFTVTVAYTDEGNNARTLTLNFSQISGTIIQTITAVTGAGAYEGVPLHIRAKAGTSITTQSAAGGVYTAVVYNIEAAITQIA